ncbi:MAG: hypothetical protein SGJ04_08365 [Bacteroidota bacterium]|nr:hypothetical protein [Bacteroidota bacterium]
MRGCNFTNGCLSSYYPFGIINLNTGKFSKLDTFKAYSITGGKLGSENVYSISDAYKIKNCAITRSNRIKYVNLGLYPEIQKTYIYFHKEYTWFVNRYRQLVALPFILF